MPIKSSSNSHKHKKLNTYTASKKPKRKRKFSLWWLLPISAISAFVFALILGNVLGNMADSVKDKETESTEDLIESENPSFTKPLEVLEIDGVFAGLEGITDNTAYNIAKQIPKGTKAVSLSMFTESGLPMYKSEVAMAFDKYCGELTLKNIFSTMKDRNIYTSVPFLSKALKNSDENKQGVLNSYEISLIKELYTYGADEIIIRLSDFGKEGLKIISSEGFTEKLRDYVMEIRLKIPDLRIGFMISSNEAALSEYSVYVSKICKIVDFCAVDLTSDCEKSAEEFSGKLSEVSVNILKNNMRLLISAKNEKDMLNITNILDKLNMTNRQIVKPYEE